MSTFAKKTLRRTTPFKRVCRRARAFISSVSACECVCALEGVFVCFSVCPEEIPLLAGFLSKLCNLCL